MAGRVRGFGGRAWRVVFVVAVLWLQMCGTTVGQDSHDNDDEDNKTTTKRPPFTAPTVIPTNAPLSKEVHTTVTTVMGSVCALMTTFILLQVFRVWYYGHNKWTYFNACLSLCFFWGVLRTALLFLYAQKTHIAASLNLESYLVLFVLPVWLQFMTLSLIVLYFCTAVLRAQPKLRRVLLHRVFWTCWLLLNAAFITINLWIATKLSKQDSIDNDDDSSSLVTTRIVVSEMLNFFVCLALVISVWKLRQLIASRTIIEGHGVTMRQITIFTAEIVPLFLSRFVYNMVATNDSNVAVWGYRFTFLSDRADLKNDDGVSFVFFVGALALWEIIPVMLITWYFWIPKRTNFYDNIGTSRKTQPDLYENSSQEDSDDDEGQEFAPVFMHTQYDSQPYGNYGSFEPYTPSSYTPMYDAFDNTPQTPLVQ
eukprot:m.82720 g.82720  ORF g.82720 m.82720 type:complete len:424 (+) comp14740_c0_seq2:591-1862(+)